MYNCQFCSTQINKAFIGTFKGQQIYSCIDCFTRSLSPIEFDDESVYYPRVGRRDIQKEDSIIMFDTKGDEVASIPLSTYQEGLIGFIRENLSDELQINYDEIVVVIKAWNQILTMDYKKS